MKKITGKLLLCFWLTIWPAAAFAAVGNIFIDTGGSASNSGTTDTNSPPAGFSGTAANWTTGTATINLDTNTNLTGLSTAGDQAVFLTNATNSNQKIFWVTGVTGCTGSGACSVTTSINVTCVTCTAQVWAIGGRMILTPTNYESAVRPGDTVTLNNSPASRSTTFITARVAGDATNGPITYKGKAGQTVTLAETGNQTAIAAATVGNVVFQNLQVTTLATSAPPINLGVSGLTGIGLKVSSCSSLTVAAITLPTLPNIRILNSEISGCGGDGISSAGSASTFDIVGNYIHGNVGNGITYSGVNLVGVIANNIITGNAKGISFSGAPNSFISSILIEHNTIYGNTSDGLNVANAFQGVVLLNNIFQDNGQTSGYNVNWTGSADLTSLHQNNVYYQSGAGTPTGNLNNLTPNSTELTTNPVFAAAGSANFAIGNAGSAAGAGLPQSWTGGNTSSFPDIGAAQRQVTVGGASGSLRPGIGQ